MRAVIRPVFKAADPIFDSVKFLVRCLHLLDQDGVGGRWIWRRLNSAEGLATTLRHSMAEDCLTVWLSQRIKLSQPNRSLTQPLVRIAHAWGFVPNPSKLHIS